MNQSKDNLNEEWRKVFDKASETPPPDIWDSIERRLGEQNRVPLAMPWWRKTQSWLAAASVLLALGIGTALFLVNKGEDAGKGPGEQVTSAANIRSETMAAAKGIADKEVNDSLAGEVIAARESAIQAGRPKGAVQAGERYAKQGKPRNSYSKQRAGLLVKADIGLAKESSQVEKPIGNSAVTSREAEEALVALDFIEPATPREIDTYWQTRYVFFNPYAGKTEEEHPNKPEAGPLWAGLNMMPGGFNPNMQFSHTSVYQMNHAVNTGYAGPLNQYTNILGVNSNRATTDNRDQPRISFQAGAQVGFKLSERWSLESGVAFLRGNSTSRSPGFFMDRTTNESADLLSNALVSGNSSYSDQTVQKLRLNSSATGTSAVYIPMDKNMSNSYSYLQVPAYVGYTFRPEKKLSYTVLGGGITNFFLQNSLETTSGYTLETKRENNVYNELSVSAATGVRLNYRMNGAWNTSLTANYQYSLTNNFKQNRFLTSRPQVYGVSWGVRYTFQK